MSTPVFGAEHPERNKLDNPKMVLTDPAVWDCVWFGNYPQSSDGKGEFHNDPIKWRVLSVEGDEALLLADKNLDMKPYHETNEESAWENSTIRKWLNGTTQTEFLGKAFNEKEQGAICEKKSGNDITDRIFLMSYNDMMNSDYGFPNHKNSIQNRKSENTDYMASKDINNARFADWWLADGSSYIYYIDHIDDSGALWTGVKDNNTNINAIRPALLLNLKSEWWSYAGTVSSDGDVKEIAEGLDHTTTLKKKTRPQTESVTTWDCVWFGNYLQDSDGNGGFIKNPIKWRVLSVEGDEALLLADKNLDRKVYQDEDAMWEESAIRKWLNGTGREAFLREAFTDAEQNAIYKKAVKNADIVNVDSDNIDRVENDTQDKVFILSAQEIQNLDYGFPRGYSATNTRYAATTDYASDKGFVGGWWLRRSPGCATQSAAHVKEGQICLSTGKHENILGSVVRPALRLNVKSMAWSYAGTVCSNGTIKEIPSKQYLDHITASKTKTIYQVNEHLFLDDLIVRAFYGDGRNKVVTAYKTNIDEIDMTTVGNKELIVTYEENAAIQTYTIPVTVMAEKKKPFQSTEPTVMNSTPQQETKTEPKATTATTKITKPSKAILKRVASPKKGQLKLTWKKDTQATGYQAMVATDKKFKKNREAATITKNKTVSKTFAKLKRKKTYFAKVRAYKQMGKSRVYSSYSKIKKSRVK